MWFWALVAAVVAIVMARRIGRRADQLERQVSEQYDLIRTLTLEVARLRREGTAPEAEIKPTAIEKPVVIAKPAPPPVAATAVPPPPPVVVSAPPPPPPLPPVGSTEPDDIGAEPLVEDGEPSAEDFEADESAARDFEAPITEPEPEPLPAFNWSFDWERLVGVKLFSAIAGIALVVAAIFFLRYSIDNGWLQPPVRVVIGVLVAISLLVACDRKAARKYPLLANAMDAAAIAILFGSFFAAHSLWNLISGPQAFGLLALVTLTAVGLSIRHDSLFIAVLGLLGGFATPILLSTGENQPIPLFAYLLLLNVGLAWVAYRTGWTVLSTLTLVFTTIYQFGWVAKFLHGSDGGQLPLAIGIFTLFPVVSYAMKAVAKSRPVMSEHAGEDTFEWTTLASSIVPALFAVYVATVPQFRDHYALLFGWVFLIDAGLLAIAIARSNGTLHAIGGGTTLLVFGAWFWNSYAPGAAVPVMGFVALFIAFFLAAQVIAARWGDEFADAGETAMLTAPVLLFVFPLLVAREPQAASTVLIFPALFALVALIVWRTFVMGEGVLYFVAAFFALATEAVWSARYLTASTLPQAVITYIAFGALYLGVPLLARRRGEPLEPRYGGGVVLLASLVLLLYISVGPVAATGLWGLALLLAILNASLFIESAAASLPIISIAGSVLSWIILFVWWSEAAATVGLLSSLLVVVGLALLMAGGHIWALQYTRRASAEASPRGFGQGLWLSLVVYAFFFAVATNGAWSIPPWPLFGALAVVTLAFSTVALAAASPPMHLASTVTATLVLMLWSDATQPNGFATVGIAAQTMMSLFALSWIWVMKRYSDFTPRVLSPPAAAVTVIALFEFSLSAMNAGSLPAPFFVALTAHVIGFVVLLALATAYEWPKAAIGFSLLAGNAAAQIMLREGHTGIDTLIHVASIYAPFALYPLVLGARARDSREPYIAALLSGAWCFFIAREGMEEAELGWMVGVVPVALGAVTTLHLRQLLKIQPSGSRDLGRLALVAGAALAFLTVAIPLQLDHQWITIGWALEGAAVAWLYTRIPHRGLLLSAAGLLGVAFVRLALNPEVFRYEPRGDMRIINWYLYTYVIAAAAMGLAAWWFSDTDDVITKKVPRLRYLLTSGSTILLFLLLNIEIADYYSDGPEILFRFGASIQQDLTYTIAWLIFGIITLAAGIVGKARAARVASVAMIAVTTFKAFLYDLGSLEGLYRVFAFVGLAISLALVSLALQKYVLAPEREAAR
jgi:uncharacterized membrane protein